LVHDRAEALRLASSKASRQVVFSDRMALLFELHKLDSGTVSVVKQAVTWCKVNQNTKGFPQF